MVIVKAIFLLGFVETPSKISGEQKKNISDAFSDLEKNFAESKKFIDKLNKNLNDKVFVFLEHQENG